MDTQDRPRAGMAASRTTPVHRNHIGQGQCIGYRLSEEADGVAEDHRAPLTEAAQWNC